MSNNASVLGAALGTLVGVLGVRKVMQYADTWTIVQNRIRLVTESNEELIASSNELFNVAQRSRTGLQGTAELYQRIARSSEQLGLSQQRVLDVTETVSKAITISGVSAVAANAAIVQLGQGLASGTLRGDELRSVLEQTPRVAQALADGLGVPIGALREMGKQGQLSSERVIAAFESQRDAIEAEFGDINVTFGQAFTQLENSVIRFLGRFGDATGIFNDMTESIQFVSKALDGLGEDFFESAFEVTQFIRAAAQGFILLPDRVAIGINEIQSSVFGFFADVRRLVSENPALGFIPIIQGLNQAANLLDAETLVEKLDTETAGLRANLAEQEQAFAASLDAEREAFLQRRAQREAAEAFDLASVIAGKGGAVTQDFVSEEDARAAERLRKELERLGETLTNQVRTPLEIFQDGVAELNRALDGGVISTETYQRNLKLLETTYRESLPAVVAWNELLEEGKTLTEELRTPQEEYNDAIARYNELRREGAITEETYNRAVARAKEELEGALGGTNNFVETLEGLANTAAQNIQSAFADFLFDPTKEGFDQMRNAFADTLQRMAADALAAQIFQSLFGAAGGGGGLGGLFGSVLTGAAAAADGGTFPAGRPVLVGEEGPEIIVPGRTSTVIPNDQSMAAMSQPEVNVTVPVTNVTDPQAMVGALESRQGQNAIVNAIEMNPDIVRRALS